MTPSSASAAVPSLAARRVLSRFGTAKDFDVRVASTWVLVGAIVLYLALDGGGYDLVVRNQVGVIVWWTIVVAALFGLVPSHVTRLAWVALALLAAFAVWTAIAVTWSHSSERSLAELSRVACYLGIFVVGIAVHRDRDSALRHTAAAVGTAIALVALIALLSRLRPGTFSGSAQSGAFLPGIQGRLGWPLNYWNGLAALVALGVPLLLAIATSARRLWAQALAAAALPMVALCGYLTFSRGGAIAASAGLIVFFLLARDRIPKVLTGLVAAGGSAVLIVGAVHRSAIENGASGALARHQGRELLVALVLVCLGVGLAQAGIGLAVRHGTPPRLLRVPPRRALWVSIAAVLCAVIIALALGAPSKLSHTWRDFKQQDSSALHTNNLSRFGSASGNGRYQYWKVSVDASSQHRLGGWGPGTFPLVWLPKSTNADFVQNAHSLYVETLLEDGVIGLALLAGLFVVLIVALGRSAWRGRYELRSYGAAGTAACVAFAVSAAFDWVWQIPVLPACFLLIGGAALAPGRRSAVTSGGRGLVLRAGMVACAVAALVAITIPLSDTTAVRQSQAAAASGDTASALGYAEAATQIEPYAASAQLQKALVLEERDQIAPALAAIRNASGDEPLNWQVWLVRSRVEAEAGHPALSLLAFKRAKSLNPHSGLFSQ